MHILCMFKYISYLYMEKIRTEGTHTHTLMYLTHCIVHVLFTYIYYIYIHICIYIYIKYY